MYASIADPYCYPGSTVLINKLGFREQAKLDAFEAQITDQRAREPVPSRRLGYSHYRAIHRHLFQDVYPWAGKVRTVRISKDGSAFCYPEHIDREMRLLFASLKKQRYLRGLPAEDFATRAAHVVAELNAIHPFREGNGRTQLSFLKVLADQAGHPLDMERLDPPAILKATIRSFDGDEKSLSKVIAGLVGS